MTIVEQQVYQKLVANTIISVLLEGKEDPEIDDYQTWNEQVIETLKGHSIGSQDALFSLISSGKLSVEDLYHESHWLDAVADYVSENKEVHSTFLYKEPQ